MAEVLVSILAGAEQEWWSRAETSKKECDGMRIQVSRPLISFASLRMSEW